MTRKMFRMIAAVATGSLLVVACGGSGDGGSGDGGGSGGGGGDAWAVDTADCIDPAAADAAIEGEIKIGGVMPLTGPTSADEAFAPVKDGWLAYMDYANEQGLLEGITINATIEDDQYDPTLTPDAVSKQIDAGVHLFSGIIGSPNNAAVRDTLNEECIPQLANLTGLPAGGEDAAEYPWTTGQLVPYTVESRIYMKALQDQGATKVALFFVNTDFGQSYADTIKAEAADFGLEVVAEQTVEPTDLAPPAGQLTTMADSGADAIIAVPLGAGCVTFLAALADKKAQTAGWTPYTYVTNTCASALILAAAGDKADGIYSSNYLLDATDPAEQGNAGVKTYVDYMTDKGLSDKISTASAGWTVAEVTVAIIKKAMESESGLTKASIIDAARNFEFTPSLARAGVSYKMNGLEDAFPFESLQVLQYDAANKVWNETSEVITEFES